ncbi:MAG: oxidoreductase [Alphaproteobacteria bacterium]|jgi:acrylyl-CoA reductase (NADPH)|nr:oxidoreductase [Alphaproteobacteria bacterium]PPR13553.1 MAG: Acrylyl-CoA reductase AcuI [Alphaproteobacteria bacterium MarineAlpha12_Bin1]|tara:strand:+ start:2467 stop:3462 length:996 start_codon:yes stop_codon:yes gene_type:complete
MADNFRALVLSEHDDKVTHEIKQLSVEDLPEGDVLVRVEYSDLNYKDGMVVNGIGGLVRDYPHVPGIDFSGVVEESSHELYKPGDTVVLTGWRVGEIHWGGYSQMARVNGDWLVPLPENISTKHAMAIGTAGLTSMLCVMALEQHGLKPDSGPILVTGAAGGVGSVAVTILASLGYSVSASTGREELQDYLISLGAKEIISRQELSEPTKRPLDREKWAGALDTVGSTTLARLLTQIKYGGSVAACGLAAGPKLETTVIPFLLRGVNLLGIDSVMQPYENRVKVWNRIANELPTNKLEEMTKIIDLSKVSENASSILSGQIRGRLVIDLND